jgi:HEAT repeat protein
MRPGYFLYVVFPATLIAELSVVAVAFLGAPPPSAVEGVAPIEPSMVRACQAATLDPASYVRRNAAQTLGIVGSLCPSAVSSFLPAVVALVSDRDLQVRVQAVEALGNTSVDT